MTVGAFLLVNLLGNFLGLWLTDTSTRYVVVPNTIHVSFTASLVYTKSIDQGQSGKSILFQIVLGIDLSWKKEKFVIFYHLYISQIFLVHRKIHIYIYKWCQCKNNIEKVYHKWNGIALFIEQCIGNQ
jgi:hypothetical protein